MKKKLLEIMAGVLIGAAIGRGLTIFSEPSHEKEKKIGQYYNILNKWLELRQENRTLYSYFKRMGYHKIGIYGMRELGQRLYYELRDSDVELYLIDKAAGNIWFEDDVISPMDGIPTVDVIIVTAAYYFDNIRKELEEKVKCPIVSIEDVVSSV